MAGIMHPYLRINKLPLNNILADGIVFRQDKRHMGFRILIEDEVVWDFPKDFHDVVSPAGSTILEYTWHNYHILSLYRFLKKYLDTPRHLLDDFEGDFVQLRDILLAADKRRSRHFLGVLLFKTDSPIARKIIHHRVRKRRAA